MKKICETIARNAGLYIGEMLDSADPFSGEDTGSGEVVAASMDILGKGSITLHISRSLAAELCRKWLGISGDVQEKIILSSVTELLNIVVGRTSAFLREELPGTIIGLPKPVDTAGDAGYNTELPFVTLCLNGECVEVSAAAAVENSNDENE